MIGDGGAYMYTTNKVLGNSTITSSGPYFIPNIKTDVYGVYTNNVPGAAFADLARRKPCTWPNCRWTNWPKNWTWTRSNSV